MLNENSGIFSVYSLSMKIRFELWLPLNTFPGGVVGDCYGDVFQIGSPGNVGSPVICGYNTGQHSE